MDLAAEVKEAVDECSNNRNTTSIYDLKSKA